MAAKTKANVRMYRLNELGDCFMVTFTTGTKKSHLLVDCGSFRNSESSMTRLREITAQIEKDLGGSTLDVVVGTHQHNDHLSGFLHCEAEFRKIGVEQVWLSWLDDPKDKTAVQIGKDHHNLLRHLTTTMHRARAKPAAKGSKAARSQEVVADMLGFFGATASAASVPEVPAKAVKVMKTLGTAKPRYLRPGDVLDMPGIPAGAVRVHVLGPPTDHASLYRKDPKKGESYDPALANASRMAAILARAADRPSGDIAAAEREYPFNVEHRRLESPDQSTALIEMQRRYRNADTAWRTIDDDWMQQAESLALYLNDFTNNSSLVLALELVESGKVLLFAADAQTGNWASWKDIVWEHGHPGTRSLLERTVLYKVGHHASHNATLVQAFEEMGGADLCAIIPVNKMDPNITKKNGWKMPASKLFKRLVERTEGRTLQMDNDNPASCDLSSATVKAAWKRAGLAPVVTPMAVELEIK
ncbi:MAG: hypothetical protein JWM95_1597 [Gemmatimonadetes bacterium]|nr:hypothetical protein [Gemmatimonadota bacterium]